MLESRSFDACMNAVVSMIAMLGHSEINTEVSNASIETAKSNSCREISGNDRNTNIILAIMQEGARFSCKDK